MSDARPSFTVHELRRIGADYLARANEAMEHARRAGAHTYIPLTDTPEEYAGQLLIAFANARQALESLEYELRHVEPGENEALWRAAREILVDAIALSDARAGRMH